MIFTKFASCLVGPNSHIVLPSERVDWEVELVVTIAREATETSESSALSTAAES
jgi:2,4-diketo-3-deoxy-L-fuconate hydrolase